MLVVILWMRVVRLPRRCVMVDFCLGCVGLWRVWRLGVMFVWFWRGSW